MDNFWPWYIAGPLIGLFVPLLYMADTYVPGAISSAALVTFIGFAGLTATVFVTRQDFSFLGGILRWGGVLAIVAIVCGVIFNWNMGMWFSVAMVGFAGAAILYDTSNVLHHYPEDRFGIICLSCLDAVVRVAPVYLSRQRLNRAPET